MSVKQYKITGLHCQHSVNKVKKAVENLDAVVHVGVMYHESVMKIEAEPQPSLHTMNDLLENLGDYKLSQN